MKKASTHAKVPCGRRFSEMRKMIAISAYKLNAILVTYSRSLLVSTAQNNPEFPFGPLQRQRG